VKYKIFVADNNKLY